MATPGASVDIITGRPILPGTAEKAAAQTAELLDQVRFAGLPGTEAVAVVSAEITRVLEGRIAEVLENDPQAKTCVKILRAIGARVATAEEAARRYTKLHLAGVPEGERPANT